MGLYLPSINPPRSSDAYFAMVDVGNKYGDKTVVTIWRKMPSGEFECGNFSEVREITMCKDCKHQPRIEKSQWDPIGKVIFPDNVCPFVCTDPLCYLPMVGEASSFFCAWGERKDEKC